MADQPRLATTVLLSILDECADGVAVVASDPWRLVFANRTFQNWIQPPSGKRRDIPLTDVFTAASRTELIELVERVQRGDASDAMLVVHMQEGCAANLPMSARVCRVGTDYQCLIGLVMRNATDLPSAELSTTGRLDPLTDLPDRAFLLSRLATLLEGDRIADRQFAVLFIDLNNFKQINDSNGHLIGDRVLREVAQRLSYCVRDGDHVTRFGGDEFVVLLEHVAGSDEIDPVIDRIHRALAEPIALPEGEFILSVSIGVAQAGPHHQSADDVLREADRQMYLAKRARSKQADFLR